MKTAGQRAVAAAERVVEYKTEGGEGGATITIVANWNTVVQAIAKELRTRDRPELRTKPPPSDRNHEAKTRSCLGCGEKFESGWAGERVCKRCKDHASWRQGD